MIAVVAIVMLRRIFWWPEVILPVRAELETDVGPTTGDGIPKGPGTASDDPDGVCTPPAPVAHQRVICSTAEGDKPIGCSTLVRVTQVPSCSTDDTRRIDAVTIPVTDNWDVAFTNAPVRELDVSWPPGQRTAKMRNSWVSPAPVACPSRKRQRGSAESSKTPALLRKSGGPTSTGYRAGRQSANWWLSYSLLELASKRCGPSRKRRCATA